MDSGQLTEKQINILELSNDINRQISNLWGMLEGNFARNSVKQGKENEAPNIPNILDEIIANQKFSSQRLAKLHEFIAQEVIPKIH